MMPDRNKLPQQFWAVVPAGGCGSRMGADKPKQYLTIAGKTILEHTLSRLLSHELIAGIAVAVASSDQYWGGLKFSTDKTLLEAVGGEERCHSVLNALNTLSTVAQPDDWVLVHDAARCCIRLQDIDKLIAELSNHRVGGILAVPVHDTIKRSGSNIEIVETVDRRHLWQAQTPQMFRLRILKEALQQALRDGFIVTDEASAIEHMGLKPKLVEGHSDNIKVTRPEDLPLAEFYLRHYLQD
jgi:2-C-methyl-D-erythritol 4-phosphate cytidylyltransferase